MTFQLVLLPPQRVISYQSCASRPVVADRVCAVLRDFCCSDATCQAVMQGVKTDRVGGGYVDRAWRTGRQYSQGEIFGDVCGVAKPGDKQ